MAEQIDSKVPQIRFKGFEGEWEDREIANICSISTGKSNTQDRVSDGIYPFYVRSAAIERSNRYLYDEEAVLTVGDGVGTGKVFHYVKGKYDLHQRVYRMHSFAQGVDAYFFFHFFANHFYKRVMAMTAKTSVDSVRLEMIAQMDFRHPSKVEQTQIGAYFRELDRLTSLHQRKHDKLVTLKKAMLRKMFPQPGATTPEIRFKGFSGDWVEKPLHGLADRYDNLRIPVTAKNRIPGNIPYYGANGIQDHVQGYTHEGEFILVAEDGANDLKNYPVQYVSGKIWVNNHAHVLQGKGGLGETRFLKYAFSQINVEAFLVGGGRAKLNAETMMEIELYAPTEIAEQQKIGAYFRTLDTLISQHATQLQKLQQLKSACLEKMFV